MPVRLLHLSDIHFGAENRGAVAAVVDFARRAPFDLMIVSGDITQSGSLAEFAVAADWLAAFPGPRLCTPGNHDTPWMGLIDRVVRPFDDYGMSIGPHAVGIFSMAGVSVRNVNTARGWQMRLNWSKGEISRPQTRRAIEAFDRDPPDDIRVLVCHHPLVEAVGEPMTARVRGGGEALNASGRRHRAQRPHPCTVLSELPVWRPADARGRRRHLVHAGTGRPREFQRGRY